MTHQAQIRHALSTIQHRPVKFGAGRCIEVTFSDDVIAIAQQQADQLGSLNNSIEGGKGNLAGFIGEMMVASYCGVHPSWAESDSPSYQFDIKVPHPELSFISFEVKTKRTTTSPDPHYDASVASCNTTQKCDWYVFTRVLVANDGEKRILPRGWILGYMPSYDYYKRARFLKKGDYDPSNGFYVKQDCYNMAYSDLYYLPARF